MKGLDITHFEKYFCELHGCRPYSWQRRLAERAITGTWPGAIDLPTGAGKTACIDIAIFAMACQASQSISERTAPIRVFFCVNRRVIVDEAYRRSREIAEKIWKAEQEESEDCPVLREVAKALRSVAGTAPECNVPPFDAIELRGGIYRDNRWARSATQPTIVCTTIDQLGSRLLFRGYGVSSNAAPIQAALVAYDSLILLDEAHISRPFLQTLTSVRHYLDPEKWAECSVGINLVVVVPMTATPPEGVAQDDMIHLDNGDRENESLDNRLTASKPARLSSVTNVVSAVLAEAKGLAKGKPKAVGVIVNRVATARDVHGELRREVRKQHPGATVELVIGSMRPIDRDSQSERLRRIVGPVGPDRPPVTEQTSFIVATQCLEVGADYDFDALITECASLDALRQRFGRLNRGGRPIDAEAIILIQKKSFKAEAKLNDDKPEDPIYGNALARTWNWLSEHSTDETVDFGVDAFDAVLARHGDEGRIPVELLAPSARLDAPVMLPAYVDFWCQTSPRPVPEPDLSLFLHGQQQCGADVQVCWRSDLVDDANMRPRDHWCDVVALLPPSSAECMTVPLSRVRRWLVQEKSGDSEGDLLGVASEEDEDADKRDLGRREQSPLTHGGVVWRGANGSEFLESRRSLWNLRPGDTLVLPEAAGGWDDLGHVPSVAENGKAKLGTAETRTTLETLKDQRIDVAETAFRAARDRAALRIHPSLFGDDFGDLLARAGDRDNVPKSAEWQELLGAAHSIMPDGGCDLEGLVENRLICERYPDKQGVVLTTRRRLGSSTDWFLPSLDEGDDSTSRIGRRAPVSLSVHMEHVVDSLRNSLISSSLAEFADALYQAAKLHDHGKVDDRFQAMLNGEGRTDAWLRTGRSSCLLAKSDGMAQTRRQRRAARERAGLPDGFRHEMLSVQLAQRASGLPEDRVSRDLVFHLIAAHHGHARPFAPVVMDQGPPDVEVDGMSLSADERLVCPAHRLNSGIGERFWSLTRYFGWWGLAYLESLLRLADQQASAAEDSGELARAFSQTTAEVPA
ncbi:MAG: type I-U CRISPR-associated helicase/endonuclease Cas3 [Planctomycetes bacterium]|nr:type I-U CRISPR-associated helicase/endonuclease Cas3 [Planctomycetota bacterium]